MTKAMTKPPVTFPVESVHPDTNGPSFLMPKVKCSGRPAGHERNENEDQLRAWPSSIRVKVTAQFSIVPTKDVPFTKECLSSGILLHCAPLLTAPLVTKFIVPISAAKHQRYTHLVNQR